MFSVIPHKAWLKQNVTLRSRCCEGLQLYYFMFCIQMQLVYYFHIEHLACLKHCKCTILHVACTCNLFIFYFHIEHLACLKHCKCTILHVACTCNLFIFYFHIHI